MTYFMLAIAPSVTVLADRACADLVTLDLSASTEKVVESLGTKLAPAALILGVSGIICTALLLKRRSVTSDARFAAK